MIDIVIITRNRPKILKKCLVSLSYNNLEKCNIIVVDSSTDNDFSKKNQLYLMELQNSSPIIMAKYIHLNIELGTLPTARNKSLPFLINPYVLFIDDDAFCNENVIFSFQELINLYPDYISFGLRIIQGEESEPEAFLKNIPHFSIFYWTRGNFNVSNIGNLEVEHLQGTCMCFHTASLVDIGGFNENLSVGYASFEDTDVSLRLTQKFKKRPLFSDSSHVVHGLAPRQLGTRNITSNLEFCKTFARNGIIVSRIKYGKIKVLFSLPFVVLINLIRIKRSLPKGQNHKTFAFIFIFIIGTIQGLFI